MAISLIKKFTDSRFFSRKTEATNFLQRIAWWEIRRIPYNLIVGIAGFASLTLVVLSAVVGELVTGVPVGLPDPPLFAFVWILIYAILANICYTGGWIAEILVVNIWGEAGKHFGVISFALGVVFSAALTLAVGLLFAGLNTIQIILHLTGHPIIQ